VAGIAFVGEQDLLIPPWQSRAVAEAIRGARFALVTGPGSSHGMHIERPDDLLRIVTGFLNDHKMQH
jgi:pimeloyl-ACP methyl ester carboxylesterase